ncbi:hypothetical protein N431DRAFT_471261 [Stipitochalara longipes BDJ]|nr:hypothetical protein N431DRAFT_471261 [Stipitochalara longipes BDJ]
MASTKQTYKPLGTDEEVSAEYDDLQDHRPRKSRWPNTSTIVLSITTAIFGLHSIYLSLHANCACLEKGAFDAGYSTEWEPARSSIELSRVKFTGAFRYNETSGTYYREHDPAEPQYIGPPSPEIDRAWEELLGGQYLILNEEEGLQLDNPVPILDQYIAEVEVMHSLHCLNAIRKSLNPEYYSVHDKHIMPAQLKTIHDEHCFEQIRQTIQCAGDLTPVPLRPYGDEHLKTYIGEPEVHTCRNWDSFRSWYTERGEKHGKVSGHKM